MDKWAVVHFIDDNTVQAVPLGWYVSQSQKCYWPPKSLSKYVSKIIKKREDPNDEWDLYRAKIMEKYDSYEKALQKTIVAQETSDLSSNSELPDSYRKRRVKKRKESYSSDDSEQTSNSPTNYPIPPKKVAKSTPDAGIAGTNPLLRTESPSGSFTGTNPLLRTESPSGSFTGTHPILIGSPRGSLTSTPTNEPRDSGNKEFQRQVLKSLNIISAKLSEHSEILQILLTNSIPDNHRNVDSETSLDEITSSLPLKDEEALRRLEELLTRNDNVKALIKELSRMGGDEAKVLTKKIMYRCFTNELGRLFSWDGAKGKKVFKSLIIAQVILKAVRENPRIKCDDDVIVHAIKNWLVRAKDRLNNSLQKKTANKSTGGDKEDDLEQTPDDDRT